MVNGLLKTVWRELINVENVKSALSKLNEINWLYKNVDKDSIDEAMKKRKKLVTCPNLCTLYWSISLTVTCLLSISLMV